MNSEDKNQGEVKRVKTGGSGGEGGSPPRDPSMVGGERGQSPEENARMKNEKEKPKEPPIIQKDVT